MRAEQNALGWMLALSVALHLALVAQFGRRARTLQRPPDPIPVEVALPSAPTQTAPAAEPVVAARDTSDTTPATPARKRRIPSPPPAPSAAPTAEDTAALTRTLQRVAATPELSTEQKRKAMLALLRTWEGRTDPETAERLINQLLETP